MAIKQVYVTSPFKYNSRMLTVGEPVQMTGPHQRLYAALGKISPEKPKVAAPKEPAVPKPKAAPRKKKAQPKK